MRKVGRVEVVQLFLGGPGASWVMGGRAKDVERPG
jgi:hypothetical protein